MANKPAAKAGGNKKGAGPMAILFAMLIAMVVIISPATVVMTIFGLLPTWAALLTDRTKDKHASFCIGGMNFSGLFPYLMDLWMGDNSLAQARMILTDVFSLAVILSAAAFGWLMFTFIPPVVGAFLTVLSQRRVQQLRGEQRVLIDEWGEAVTRTKEQEDAHAGSNKGPRPAPTPSKG